MNAAEPKKIGYKTFPNGHAAYRYYKALLKDLSKNQDLNEVRHCKTSTKDYSHRLATHCRREKLLLPCMKI